MIKVKKVKWSGSRIGPTISCSLLLLLPLVISMFIASIAFTTVVSNTYHFAIFHLLRRRFNYSDYSFSFHPFLTLLLRTVRIYRAGTMKIFRDDLVACDRFREIIATSLSDIDRLTIKFQKRQSTYMKNPFGMIRNSTREVQPTFWPMKLFCMINGSRSKERIEFCSK